MLIKLTIKNYAIIELLEISFSSKLNILTGETGAGKSIIVGALGLILGERADSSVLVNLPDRQEAKEKKCVIEGKFEVKGKEEVKTFLSENDFDCAEELVVRREININGKSRAFINDTPATLLQLTALSNMLVDLHQQFDTLELGESGFQRDVIDALAANAGPLNEYRAVFRQWQQVKRECDELKNKKHEFEREADYNKFQYSELEEAGFKENELEDIEAELRILNHSESIKEALTKVYYELRESENPVVQQVKSLLSLLNYSSSFHPGLSGILQRIQSAQIELQDIAEEVESISGRVNYDPEKIEQLNERLSLGYKLQKKHGTQSTNELLTIQRQLEEKLKAVLNIDEAIRQLETETTHLGLNAEKLAGKISDSRHRQINPLEEKVNKLLVQVGMPNARLKVQIKPSELSLSGSDHIEFLFHANLPLTLSGKLRESGTSQAGISGEYQPIRKVASGGELSRLMLCIKSLVAQSMDLPTLIFDEIDTGISGEAARQIGTIMKDLATRRQVISITHQPQIAGRADVHFFVYKEIVKDAVRTNIRPLTTEERIMVIAKMLSGEKPTAAAMENAREMMGN